MSESPSLSRSAKRAPRPSLTESAPETPEIRAILEPALERWPDHPALAHLYIHTMEAGPYAAELLPVAEHLEDLTPGSFRIILGRELAGVLGVTIGDKVTVVIPQVTVTVAGSMPRLKRFTVAGLFEVGMGEYDRGVAMVHIRDAAVLQQLDEAVTGVRIRIDDVWEARRVGFELAEAMQGRYRVLNWTDYHRNFFAALKMEKRMMGLLLFFIVVAGSGVYVQLQANKDFEAEAYNRMAS